MAEDQGLAVNMQMQVIRSAGDIAVSMLAPNEVLGKNALQTPPPGQETQPTVCHLHRETLPCPECQRQEQERIGRKRSEAIARFSQIQIGKRFAHLTFDDYKPVCDEASGVKRICKYFADSFPARLEHGDNLILLGNPGTGKNMLAACICRSVSDQEYSVLHTTAIKMVRKIRESWKRDGELTEQEAIDQFSKPDLLVVDEVGVQYGTDAEKILFFDVINDRYEGKRPTVLISNLDMTGLTHYLGERTIDRFHEGDSACLEFTWDSWRRGAHADQK